MQKTLPSSTSIINKEFFYVFLCISVCSSKKNFFKSLITQKNKIAHYKVTKMKTDTSETVRGMVIALGVRSK